MTELLQRSGRAKVTRALCNAAFSLGEESRKVFGTRACQGIFGLAGLASDAARPAAALNLACS